MQKNSKLLNFCQKFDIAYNNVCNKIAQNNSFDLIGTEESLWKYLVSSNGVITIESQYNDPNKEPQIYEGVRRTLCTMFDPVKVLNFSCKKPISHTCLDGFLPVSVVIFINSNNEETTLTCLANKEGDLLVKVKFANQEKYFKTLMPQSDNPGTLFNMDDPQITPLTNSTQFEEALTYTKNYWYKKLENVLSFNIPSTHLKNGIAAAFVKAFLSQYNGALRYGATRYYCDEAKCAESFPPTIFTFVEASRFFNIALDGEKFFSYFLKTFVNSNGEIIHRGNGASLSEHGMLLEQAALCSKSFIDTHKTIINAVANRLLKLIENGKLIACCPEDDLRDCPYQEYFSCNFWVIKGLEEYHKIFQLTNEELNKLAKFKSYAIEVCQSSTIKVKDNVFVPPFANWKEPFKDMNDFINLIASDEIHSLASYTNYRFYPEMLSSGILDKETALHIVNYRKNFGGDFHGATAFRIFRDFPPYFKCLDDWPLYNYLKGLIIYNQEDEFIRILAGHMALHQSRGTFFAPEMSFPDRLDSTHCVPSQLIVPLAISYLLS